MKKFLLLSILYFCNGFGVEVIIKYIPPESLNCIIRGNISMTDSGVCPVTNILSMSKLSDEFNTETKKIKYQLMIVRRIIGKLGFDYYWGPKKIVDSFLMQKYIYTIFSCQDHRYAEEQYFSCIVAYSLLKQIVTLYLTEDDFNSFESTEEPFINNKESLKRLMNKHIDLTEKQRKYLVKKCCNHWCKWTPFSEFCSQCKRQKVCIQALHKEIEGPKEFLRKFL